MRTWNLADHEVEPRKPTVLGTASEGRAILVNLPEGDSMPEHQVRERATVIIVNGTIEITGSDGNTLTGDAGTLVVFEPAESHSLVAKTDSRFLLLIAPWSLEEHSSMEPWKADSP